MSGAISDMIGGIFDSVGNLVKQLAELQIAATEAGYESESIIEKAFSAGSSAAQSAIPSGTPPTDT